MLNRKEAVAAVLTEKKRLLDLKLNEYENKIALLKSVDKEFADIENEQGTLGAAMALTALSGDGENLAVLKERLSSIAKKKAEILKKADIKPIEYACKKCLDTGYSDGKLCDCVKAAATELILADAEKSLPLTESRFENFDLNYYPERSGETFPKKRMTEILKLCREYTITFSPEASKNLLFMGNSGLGKTHLSLAIVHDLLKRGYDCIYGSAYNLLSAMESDHFETHTNTSYDAAVSCDLLVIDDLGSEFMSPYIQSCVYNLINTRLLSKKPTVISTNLSMKELEERYTPRITSRLIGNYTAKKFIGNDIRQIKNM